MLHQSLGRPHPRDEGVDADAEGFSLAGQIHGGLQDVLRGPTGVGSGLAHAADVQGNVARILRGLIGAARDRGGRGVLLLENALRLGHAPIPSPVGLMKKV
jgi:hypothetical protein